MKTSARGAKGLAPSSSLAQEQLTPGARKAIELFPIKPPRRIELVQNKPHSKDKPGGVASPRNTHQSRVETNLKRLEKQVQKINRLSVQTEEALRELKTIATRVNQDIRRVRRQHRRLNVCEYREVRLPVVRQKSDGRLVLMSRSVDLSAVSSNTTVAKS
ncbi:MAG: hypothetical protein ACFB4I_11985 [Cyanophyceae cyanobacterium]